MVLPIEDIENFYQLNPSNTTAVWFKNHYPPIKRLLTECLNIKSDAIHCLRKYNDVIQRITETYDNANTRRYYLRSLLYLLDNYPGLSDKVKKQPYLDAYNASKVYKIEQDETKPTIANVRFQDIRAKVSKTFGEASTELLLIDFYKETPVRLDLSDIQIFFDVKKLPDPVPDKYLTLRSKMLVMNKYNKTSETYGKKEVRLSDPLINKIRDSLKLNPRSTLFTFPNTQGLYISKILRTSGIKDGTLLTLRHSVLSQEMTPEERVEIAKVAGHSASTSMEYRRPENPGLMMNIPVTLQERVYQLILQEQQKNAAT